MPFACKFEISVCDLVVCVQVQQRPFEVRYAALCGDLNSCKAIDRSNSLKHIAELLVGHQICLVDKDDIGMADLEMCSGQERPVALTTLTMLFDLHCVLIAEALIKALENIFCVNQSHYPV